MTLKLGSYNLHKCVGTDRRRSPRRTLEVINALGADIIALQEVDLRLGNRPAALTRAMIETGSDYCAPDIAESPVSLGWHGGTILVRRGLPITRTARLPLPGLEPRGAVIVEVAGARHGLRIIGVHLGLLRRYRTLQMKAIREALATMSALPTVIMGDFNEWSPRSGMEELSDVFRVHSPGHSFHARRPIAALDRFALGQGVKLEDAGVEQTPQSQVASDHLPVWARIRLPDAVR